MSKSNTTPNLEREQRIEDAKKRMEWDEERRGEPTLLEYLRYYRSGEIGEIHIEAVVSQHTDRAVAQTRHEIATKAPPCKHNLKDETEHQAFCGFVNDIWTNWAIKNGAKQNLDGSYSVAHIKSGGGEK